MFCLLLFLGNGFILSQEKVEQEEGSKVKEDFIGKELPKEIFVKPDIVLEKIWFTSESYSRGKIKVHINYTVFNNSSAVSYCCPTDKGTQAWQEDPMNNQFFLCKVFAASYPKGRSYLLPRAPNDGTHYVMLNPQEKKNYSAFIILKKGKSMKFRVKLDSEDWINEKKEDNNIGTRIWPPVRRQK